MRNLLKTFALFCAFAGLASCAAKVPLRYETDQIMGRADSLLKVLVRTDTEKFADIGRAADLLKKAPKINPQDYKDVQKYLKGARKEMPRKPAGFDREQIVRYDGFADRALAALERLMADAEGYGPLTDAEFLQKKAAEKDELAPLQRAAYDSEILKINQLLGEKATEFAQIGGKYRKMKTMQRFTIEE